jgi:hypothetical protein
MHNDTTVEEDVGAWVPYLSRLRRSGEFEGGSSIGEGATFRAVEEPKPRTGVTGYFLVNTKDLASAQVYREGNPTFVAGGTVEIRRLIED